MKKVFVVDDNDSVLEKMNLNLMQIGYYPILASSFDMLAVVLKNDKPDLILLDVILKTADGKAICKKIKDDPNSTGIPLILFSTHKGLAEYANYEADGVLETPFDIPQLMLTLNKTYSTTKSIKVTKPLKEKENYTTKETLLVC